jgi:hypothetical protein
MDSKPVCTVDVKVAPEQNRSKFSWFAIIVIVTGFVGLLAIEATNFATLGLVREIQKDMDASDGATILLASKANMLEDTNICKDKKPLHSGPGKTDEYFKNVQCTIDGVKQALEQVSRCQKSNLLIVSCPPRTPFPISLAFH